MTALRFLGKTTNSAKKNLERLSSGMRINTAADGPAALMISERMRAQISGLDQAIKNSETSISMVQTAEGALNEVSNILINLRQLAIHAANEGANDEQMLDADQSEIENLLSSLDRIARNTQFGTRNLLDGSNGANGVAVGEGLLFVEADVKTEASPEQGHEVNITQVATRATATGIEQIGVDNADGLRFVINEGGKTASLNTKHGEINEAIQKLIKAHRDDPERSTAEDTNKAIQGIVARQLQGVADENNLKVDVYIDKAGMLTVRHKEFGSKPSFTVTCNKDNILSKKADIAEQANPGVDVAGFIGGEVALGEGQYLTGAKGTKGEGLTVQYTKTLGSKVKDIRDPDTGEVTGQEVILENNDSLVGGEIDGYVHVSQRSLAYQVGPNRGQLVRVSIDNVSSNRLARGIKNDSDFESLADIDVTNSRGSQDSIMLIDKAISQVSELRGNLGSFQKNALESNLNSLRVATENLTNAESIVRDSDMASEMSDFTKNQIMLASGTAMAAQANQIPRSVLQLIQGAQ